MPDRSLGMVVQKEKEEGWRRLWKETRSETKPVTLQMKKSLGKKKKPTFQGLERRLKKKVEKEANKL